MKILATIMLALAASVAVANPAIDAAALEQATHPERRTVSGAALLNLDNVTPNLGVTVSVPSEAPVSELYPTNLGEATNDEGYPRKK